jgi:hypothetical protein
MAIKIKDFLEAEKITGNKRNTRVEFTCIECKETIEQSLESLLKKGKLICGKCSALKNRDYEAIAKKCKETNLRKYGTTSNLSVINKQRAENGELSGAANPEIKAKMAETNLKKYGSKSPFGNKQVREKVKSTLQEKYNVDHNFKIKEFKEKRAQEAITRNQKYRNSDTYRDFFISKYVLPKNMSVNNTIIKDNELYYNLKCNKCSCEFEWSIKDRINGGKQYPYCDKCFNNGSSYEEDTVYEFIKSIYDGPILRNTRNELDGKEIDIYLPEKKFGIEYNGLYWHAGERNRHREKWEIAQKKEIDLMQIWSCEWETKRHILESIIKNRLGLAKPLYARKCEIRQVPVKEARKFADENHMQGFFPGIYIGLYYENELVDMSIYCEARFGGDYSWELTRHVIKHGLRVIGGLSRELKYFRNMGHHGDIVDYCDMRLFNGKGHWSFEEKGITPPDMQYTDFVRIIPRGKYQKKNMHKIPGFVFDPSKTQKENLHANGMDFIYGVGHKIFVNKEN